MTHYFVTAIGTDCGKTLVSAILCEALGADYWKPVQAGEPKDRDQIQRLVTHKDTQIHPERYVLNTPASPHAAARIDGVHISLSDFRLPESRNKIIVEGAGGCLVPLNDDDLVIDLIQQLALPVIVVSNLYLGSINHTLLTAEALKNRSLDVAGVIFNGPPNKESEQVILRHTRWNDLLHILPEKTIDTTIIAKYASELKRNNYGGLGQAR